MCYKLQCNHARSSAMKLPVKNYWDMINCDAIARESRRSRGRDRARGKRRGNFPRLWIVRDATHHRQVPKFRSSATEPRPFAPFFTPRRPEKRCRKASEGSTRSDRFANVSRSLIRQATYIYFPSRGRVGGVVKKSTLRLLVRSRRGSSRCARAHQLIVATSRYFNERAITKYAARN